MNIHETLKTYWGYDSFRPLQEEIIRSVLAGNDTLALLPTGGGKSLCFQVPAMAGEGICIVVSPLIALMKDQVEHLTAKGISAKAIYSGLSYHENNLILNNCIHGEIRFLYLSPERLRSEIVREHIKQMQVSLFAVDEAHCISQWGYDFRPEYLQIAEIRTYFPKVPIMALTASATTDVVNDIQEKLGFKKKNVFVKSFERKNISYVVNRTEDKFGKLLHILSRVKGSTLVYVRNRKKTQEISHFLKMKGYRSDYYHAGLTHELRMHKQEAWIKNQTRIMVCTNAFGMGIDKPDVRLVIHFEIPDSPESYYQEAGRAGRDEQKAYAVLLYGKPDEHEAIDRLKLNYPENKDIIRVYNALCNYYALAVGFNADRSYDFDIGDFDEKFKIHPSIVYGALKTLEAADLLMMSDSFYEPAKLKILLHHDQLYKFQVEHPQYDNFIKLLLRCYGGLFDQHTAIQESVIARRGQTEEHTVVKLLNFMHQQRLVDYLPQKDKPQIVFLHSRIANEEFPAYHHRINERKKIAVNKLNALVEYAGNDAVCRSRKLVAYFDQSDSHDCGICDICLQQKKMNLSAVEFESLIEQIKYQCLIKAQPVNTLAESVHTASPEKIIEVVRYLLDNDKLHYNEQQHLKWKE
ncbi:MAG: ATP-dependent DNA helicase RecQ [Bacteroidia bacterium]